MRHVDEARTGAIRATTSAVRRFIPGARAVARPWQRNLRQTEHAAGAVELAQGLSGHVARAAAMRGSSLDKLASAPLSLYASPRCDT